MQSGQSKARLSFGISEWGCVTAFSDQIRHGSRLSPFCREKSKPVKSGFVGPVLNRTEAEGSGRADLQVVP